MADNEQDVRTKINRQDHAVLVAVSQAQGREIAEILRDLIRQFVDSKVRESKLIVANLNTNGEGGGATGGAARGKSGFDLPDPADVGAEGS